MNRQSTAKAAPYSASNALEAIGKALHEIKAEDGLTWIDVGAELGVSDDQAAKYAEGSAAMNAVTYGRGKKKWGSRFTGYFDRLCDDSAAEVEDRSCETSVLKAALALSVALADDQKITNEEIRLNRAAIEEASDALRSLLSRLKVAA